MGLGNIWRFPYLAAKYGGGIFLLTYILLAVTFGFALFLSETAIGRMTGKSSIGAFRALGAKRLMPGGWPCAVIPMLITPYYSVIGGWVCNLFEYIRGNRAAIAADAYFGGFLEETVSPIFWFVLFAATTFIIVVMGVEKGVGRASRTLMPVLVGFDRIIAEVKESSAFKREKAYVFCTKYLVIPGLVIILVSSILSGFGIITM